MPGAKFATIKGMVPDLRKLPTGCRFQGRCDIEKDRCRTAEPPLVQLGDKRQSRCFFAEDLLKTPMAANEAGT